MKREHVTLVAVVVLLFLSIVVHADFGKIIIVTNEPDNDLAKILVSSYPNVTILNDLDKAVFDSSNGSSLFILADDYPNTQVEIMDYHVMIMKKKNLSAFVEFPNVIPGRPDLTPGKLMTTVWERAVVTTTEFGASLAPMRILTPNGCVFVPVGNKQLPLPNGTLITIARIAGVNTAVFNLTDTDVYPMLLKVPLTSSANIYVSTTKISHFLQSRFAPSAPWNTVMNYLISKLAAKFRPNKSPNIPNPVHPMYTKTDPLPNNWEIDTFTRGINFFLKSKFFPDEGRHNYIEQQAVVRNFLLEQPANNAPSGNGSFGVVEGFRSLVNATGGQYQSTYVRTDCNGETAGAFAHASQLLPDFQDRTHALIKSQELLNYVWKTSIAFQGPYNTPSNPAYGLIAWVINNPDAHNITFADDAARNFIASVQALSIINPKIAHEYEEELLRNLLGHIRTTGFLGFRPDSIRVDDLEKNGWQPYWDSSTTEYAPHYQAMLWAVHLWGYQMTGYKPFYDRAQLAIEMTMASYNSGDGKGYGWTWTNGMTQERSKMLVALAWLVRVDPSAKHKEWLNQIAMDLIEKQDACGAIQEEIGRAGMGQMYPPTSNKDYGQREAPLLQTNGDKIADMLYSEPFAFMGFHEAYAATKNPAYKKAEDKLAEFFARIQVNSTTRFPYLDGGWFRAFDFDTWEYWASSSDIGWGITSIESGWTQAEILSIMGNRLSGTNIWDLTTKGPINLKPRVADALKKFGLPPM